MAATIKMVASRAGVSVATVSKYINGGNVIPENREKVQNAIDELDYKINEVARSLKTNKTYTVGILAASIKSEFIAGLIAAMQYRFLELGYSSIIADFQADSKVESKQIEVLLKRQVDGIVIFPLGYEKDIIESIREYKIPIVMVDNLVEEVECDAVLSDSRTGIKEQVELLIENGHKKIGIITGPENMYTAVARLQGYLDALELSGIDVDLELIKYSDYNMGGGYESMKEILASEERPTAIVAANYYIAIGALKAMKESGIKISDDMDITIIAFDDSDFLYILDADIRMICQPMEEMGRLTAERMVQRINGNYEGYPIVDKLKTITK